MTMEFALCSTARESLRSCASACRQRVTSRAIPTRPMISPAGLRKGTFVTRIQRSLPSAETTCSILLISGTPCRSTSSSEA